jgi:hypothetical protein
MRCVTPSETHLARGRRATDAFCAAWRRVRRVNERLARQRRVWCVKDVSGAAQTLCDALDAWEHVGRGAGATRHIERAKSPSDASQMYCDAPGGLQGREGKMIGECLRE